MPTRPRTATSITAGDLRTWRMLRSERSEEKIVGLDGRSSMASVADSTERRDALVERLFLNAVGAFDLFSVYLGDRLGLYRVIADDGPLPSAELADAAGVQGRHAREWLEHQAASELLDVEANGGERRFSLPEGHREALLDVSSLNYVAPLGRAVLESVRPPDALTRGRRARAGRRSEEHTSELQSRGQIVCPVLPEKKKCAHRRPRRGGCTVQ